MTALLTLVLAFQEPPSFKKEDRLVAAYYRLGDPLPDPAALSRELAEMGKAGIDVVVPVAAREAGVAALAAALDELDKESKERPRAAVFLASPDASVLPLPARHRALVDGRPIAWLGPLPPKSRPPPVRESLARVLGADPFLVADVTWPEAGADRTVAWGAQAGTPADLAVVSVGPGKDRDEGRLYERAWAVAVRLDPRMVVVESWNGWPEGSGVAESPEHGRRYVDATARFVKKYKLGEKIVLPKGKWTGASKALYTLKYNPHEQGLRPVSHPEGLFESIQLRGIAVLSTKENKAGSARSLSFDVDDSFCYFDKRSFEVEVEFLDAGEGVFRLEYDSADRKLPPDQRPLRSAGEITFQGTGEWRTEKFELPDALFGNRQPGGADFRLVLDKRGITVRRVAVLPR
jgi:hypothetical protein